MGATGKALVLLSGGQDSTTALCRAIDRFGRKNVATVSFDYGQRHRVALGCAARIADIARVGHVCLRIDTFAAIGGDALTDRAIDVRADEQADGGLPNTFMPGRDLVFLTFTAAVAWRRGVDHLVAGVAQTDYSGYPDCRDTTIQALQQTLRLGMESDVTIHTPLMHLSKKETIELAIVLGALEAMADTDTCYNGKRPPCGKCQACILRAKRFAEAGVEDPLAMTP